MVSDKAKADSSKQMFDLLVMGRTLPLIYVVAKLGIADFLKDGPRTISDLAKESRTRKAPLYRILRALSAVGIFEETGPETFSLALLGQTLRTDSPKSLSGLAIMFGSPYFWRPWGELTSAVEGGAVPFEKCFGEEFFSYLSKDREANRVFNQAMTASSDQTVDAVVSSYDFSQFRTCIDVGGGKGALAKKILSQYPSMKVAVFEAPTVTQETVDSSCPSGLPPGVEYLTGDFFKSIPSGFDTYLFQKIIHDWGDKEAVQILTQCGRVIEKTGKLILIESVIREGGNSITMLLKDIEMLVMTKGGKERTESEFKAILKEAGFDLTKIIDTGTSLSIIEAIPI